MAPQKRTTSPAFQFYPKDFLSSTKVQRMTLTEVGIYALLLSHCWLDNGLPNDIKQLARIVKVQDRRFARMWAGPLSECFHERNGRLHNERLDKERKKQTEFRRRQSDNAASGWQHRRQRRGDAVALPEQRRNDALQSPISNFQSPERTNTQADPPFDVWFQGLHQAYPAHRRGAANPLLVQQFIKTFNGCDDSQAHFNRLMTALVNHQASEDWAKGYVPKLSNWLEGAWGSVLKPAAKPEGSSWAERRMAREAAAKAGV